MAKDQDNQQSTRNESHNDGKMTVEEAGRKGGQATSETHDREFYERIGSEGGKVSGGNFKSNPERAAEAGREGGRRSGNQRDTEAA